ncbi:hypothetical protein PBCV1_a549R [Paramecium bursaria Chlorella virus 1]|uniref:Uncharacterized protein n=1 Tax=Paramecium bursaria Chlorella virus 1 TaxID=10506 RepID=O41031_PBCV1|nr:hypothetical protein PBCV1_a549R [Paramecium bursaria Chlorella virus 1]AAC96996.1 hypothetical protein [Paramecium bursaria Chlorella virus 1]
MQHFPDCVHFANPVAENKSLLYWIVLNLLPEHVQLRAISLPLLILGIRIKNLRVCDTLSHPHELLEQAHTSFTITICVICP